MNAVVTADGQVTIPEQVRELLGLEPGSEVEFKRSGDGSVVLSRVAGSKMPADRFSQFLGHAGPGPSTDEIMAMTRGEV